MTGRSSWTVGQRLAADQLAALHEADPRAIESVGEAFLPALGTAQLDVSLNLAGLPHAPGGISVRAREWFRILVGPRFPFEPPSVWVVHRRWAGTSHVQWGRSLCLYAALSNKWQPADGMRGLVDRLSLWLQKAALGELDPDGQPLHPPANYKKGSAGRVVVRADLAGRMPWAPGAGGGPTLLVALCEHDGADRLDVVGWTTPTSWSGGPPPARRSRTTTAGRS